jgi:hypothetical protein
MMEMLTFVFAGFMLYCALLLLPSMCFYHMAAEYED